MDENNNLQRIEREEQLINLIKQLPQEDTQKIIEYATQLIRSNSLDSKTYHNLK